MVELLIVGGVVAAGMLMRSSRRPVPIAYGGGPETGSDLPCPWCHAETLESDDRCPGCGQVFG